MTTPETDPDALPPIIAPAGDPARKTQMRGIALLLMAIVVFSLMDATAKHLGEDYPPAQIVWARFVGNLVIVVVIFGPRLRRTLVSTRPGLQLARGLSHIASSALFFTSLQFIGLAEATAIMDINPVLITLGAALFLGESIGWRRILGIAAALIGALIIIRPGAGVFQPAALLPLACAICYAGFALATRKAGATESPATSLIYSALFGTVVSTMAMPMVYQPIAGGDLWGFVLIGAIGSLAQFFLIRAFTLAEASVIAPFGYVGILFATFWGVLIFDEWPDGWTALGALVIAGAGLYVWHRETRIQGAG